MRMALAGIVVGLGLGYVLGGWAAPSPETALANEELRPRLQRVLGLRFDRLERRARRRCIAEGGARQAVVVNNVDPEGRNRLQVVFPFHDDEEDAPVWVQVSLPFTDPSQAQPLPPPVGSTVLVVFEQGDTRRGIAVGLVPPAAD